MSVSGESAVIVVVEALSLINIISLQSAVPAAL